MNKNKTLLSLFTIILLVIASCSKDSSPAAVSPDKAKQTFAAVNTDLASDIGGLNAAPGNIALASFSNLTGTPGNPLGRTRSFKKPGEIREALKAGITSVRQMLLKASGNTRMQGDTPFGFNDKKGVYIYNFGTGEFDKSQTTSDIIKIDYPKNESSVENDAELQISAYTEAETPQGYNPTLVQMAIYLPVGGTKEVELKLTAGYDGDGNPNKGSIDLFVNPYTISLSFDDSQPVSATEAFSFSKDDKVLIGIELSATFASAADKENGNPPSAVSGHLQLENVRFDVSIDGVKASTAQSNNDYILITVGHVIWKTDSQSGEEQPFVQYNDQTTESLDSVFADLKDQLDSIG